MRTLTCIIFIKTFIVATACAQINTEDVQLVIKAGRMEAPLQYPEDIRSFYQTNGYKYAWVNDSANTKFLLQLLNDAASFGLQEEDYQFHFIRSMKNTLFNPSTYHDSLQAEIRFTDAAIHFFRDVAYGNRKPAMGYNGLNYMPACFNIPVLLASAINEHRLPELLKVMEPQLPGYATLKDWLAVFNQCLTDSAFKETPVTSAAANNKNGPLLHKLYYLGIIDSLSVQYTDAEIKRKVRSAQRLFNLTDNGTLGKLTIHELNMPLALRIKELQAAMNTIRWLNCISLQSPVFVVNIPSATLLILHKGTVLLESKIIVGKRSTPTPTLASTITDVVLYPYWVVPEKIATRELLPVIKHKISYLEDNNMQVLTKAGKIVDPYSINWNSLSPSWFPYVLRQSTGCDNSLGVVKLNFYSPYSVYLHDTPWKVLFNFNKRYFSHGCMRVQKAGDLARFLLKENRIAIDTLEEKGCLRNQRPVTLPVANRVPVFVLYNTAWFDSTGIVQFNEDVYGKMNTGRKVLKQ